MHIEENLVERIVVVPDRKPIDADNRGVNVENNLILDRHKGSSRKQRIIKVPELSGELVSFQTFMSKQQDKVSVEKARHEYEIYKKAWAEKYNETFLNDHKVT